FRPPPDHMSITVYLRPFSTPPNIAVSLSTPTSTTEIYTLSLHDALPICQRSIVISIRRTVKTIFHFLLFLIPFAFISIFYTSTILASRQKTNQTERNIYPFKRLHHIFF